MSSNPPFMQPPAVTVASATDLRPLPIGELLDRAFHLYFKHFVAFVAILAIVLVPHAIVQYFQSKDFLDVFISVLQQRPSGGRPPAPPDLSKLSSMSMTDIEETPPNRWRRANEPKSSPWRKTCPACGGPRPRRPPTGNGSRDCYSIESS